MNLSAHDITARLLTLPEQQQQKALDFIEFLQNKLARQQIKNTHAHQENTPTEGTKALNILQEYGLLGCMEGDSTLSEDYKQHLWGKE